jgi:hypothetical protein
VGALDPVSPVVFVTHLHSGPTVGYPDLILMARTAGSLALSGRHQR